MAVQMDSLARRRADAQESATLPDEATAPLPDVALMAAMPPSAPLNMPVQSLAQFDPSMCRRPSVQRKEPWLARVLVFGGAAALTLYGGIEMYRVVNVVQVTMLEWLLVLLFVANFSWIALAFCNSVVGMVWLLFFAPKKPALPDCLNLRTAIVMPIYNEAPIRVFATLQAIIEDVEATGLGGAFDYFLLSDTTDPNLFIAEERAFISLRQRVGARVFYRHREKNISRKAGNIADFVSGWGGAYPQMLVLDADSLMTGHAIVTLATAMENDPDAGIIQSLPLIINRNTLFARLQQFAARIYGPVIAAGLAVWSGRDGNYWGHNAIIRTKAFASHCALPTLGGRPPFGGHILSHDFVEAALMRRAGYDVYMLPVLGGSFEESPPSLIDLSARDRRWCQGNLQHARVIGARGLHWASRQHFATGIMGYVASPLWMAQLLVGILLVLQFHYIRPEYFATGFSLYPAWPRFDAERSLQLFEVTMGVLLAPKFFGMIWSLLESKTRRACGGGVLLVISTLFEVIFSALFAPIMMLIQSGSVLQILSGRDSGWNPQRRNDGSIPFADIVRRHRSHTLMGLFSLFAALLISPSLAAWMSPTIAGLALAIPLSWASGKLSFGLRLKSMRLLLTPEENLPPPIATRANALTVELSRENNAIGDGLVLLHENAALRASHDLLLPPGKLRPRGDITAERAMALAKLNDAQTLGDALRWLSPKERMVVMHDRALMSLFVRLPAGTP